MYSVMPELDPGIRGDTLGPEVLDRRVKPGDDVEEMRLEKQLP